MDIELFFSFEDVNAIIIIMKIQISNKVNNNLNPLIFN